MAQGGELLRGLFELLMDHPEGPEARVALAARAPKGRRHRGAHRGRRAGLRRARGGGGSGVVRNPRILARSPRVRVPGLVAALLRAMGYHVSWVAPPGPDRGVDIIARTDPLGATLQGSRCR